MLRNAAFEAWQSAWGACAWVAAQPHDYDALALTWPPPASCAPHIPPCSVPPAGWRYDYQVEPNSPEAQFLNAVRNAKDQNWV